MRKRRLSFVLVGLLTMALMLNGCGASKSSDTQENSMVGNTDTSAVADGLQPEEAAQDVNLSYGEADKATAGDTNAGNSGTGASTAVNPNQKLIRTFNLQLETQEYDSLVPAVQKKVIELGGYVESSQLDGKSYFEDDQRYAQMVVRVPKEKVDEFVSTVSKMGNVVSKTENAQDVTLAYTDTESHTKSLRIEQERLLSLLEKATKLEDIITLENRLSEVRYQIESYESQLRMYDNQVDYSTVTLTISEVKRITVVDDITTLDKMKTGFSETIYNITTGMVNFAIWFVVNLPYLLIWAVILVVLVMIVRKNIRKYNKMNNKTKTIKEETDTNQEQEKKSE